MSNTSSIAECAKRSVAHGSPHCVRWGPGIARSPGSIPNNLLAGVRAGKDLSASLYAVDSIDLSDEAEKGTAVRFQGREPRAQRRPHRATAGYPIFFGGRRRMRVASRMTSGLISR